jgi:hypothetical protein
VEATTLAADRPHASAAIRAKAQTQTGQEGGCIVIQEAGLDGCWIHRVLEREAIESYDSIRHRSPHPAGAAV